MNIFNKNTSNIILIVLFISILLFLSIINIPSIYKAYKNAAKAENIMLVNKEFEKDYKNNFYGKSKFIDLYGLSLTMLNKKTVLNLQQINIDGIVVTNATMHENTKKFSDDNIINNINMLSAIAKENNIKFIYMQQPYQTNIIPEHFQKLLNINFPKTINKLKLFLQDNITYIDVYDELIHNGFNNENIFFKTDIHNQTFAELSIIKLLLNTLEQNGFYFKENEKSKILNLQNYDIITREFRGNTIASAGKFFGKSDIFEMYIPKFSTNLKVTIEQDVVNTGSFQEVLMHGYEKNNIYNQYYVTNYGFFTKVLFYIENLMVDNDYNILFIADSLSTRFISYFALLNKKITVFDPRFNHNSSLLVDLIKNNKYDCIVMSIGEPSILYKSNLGIGK